MKLKKMILALAALTAGTSAYGDESDRGTVANLTLKLTEYLTDSALFLKNDAGKLVLDEGKKKILTDENFYSVESASKIVSTFEYGSKITTYKISNKQFLEALREEEGLIPDIKGWAVVVVQSEEDPSLFITKKGEDPIDVSQYLRLLFLDASAEKVSYKSVETQVISTENSTETETGSFQGKFLVGIKSGFSSSSLELQGVYDESAILRTFGKGDEKYTQWMHGRRSVNSITGSLKFDDESESDDAQDPSVITGSISIAAGKQVPDLSLYFGSESEL